MVFERIDRQPPDIQTHSGIFDDIFNTVDPRNPVWALNSKAPLVLLEETDYSHGEVAYTEQMIRQHTDDMVVRHLVLHLIERRANDFSDVKDMPYFNWIVERYREKNRTRRADVAFKKARQSR